MTSRTPNAYALLPEHARELHDYLLGQPMKDVRVHVERLESLKPLYASENGSPESDRKDTTDGDE